MQHKTFEINYDYDSHVEKTTIAEFWNSKESSDRFKCPD